MREGIISLSSFDDRSVALPLWWKSLKLKRSTRLTKPSVRSLLNIIFRSIVQVRSR